MFENAKKKILKEATCTLFWTSVIVGIGSGFYQGFSAAVINAPQTVMGLWIREIECGKLNQTDSPSVNDTEKWCKVLSEKEQEKMFKENPMLNVIWTGIASIYTLGSVIGALSIIPVCQRFGRKGALLFNGIPCISSSLILGLSYVAHSYWMLAAGRLINGFGAGVCASIATIYLTEIAPVSLRGLFGIIRGVCLFGGQLCAQVLGHPDILGTSTLWPLLFGFGLLPALAQLLLLPFCPDSPSYLYLDRGSTKKGTKALKQLRGDSVFEIELAELKNKKEFEAESNESVSVYGLFKNPFLRHCIIIAVVMNMGTELVGYSAILFYSTSVFLGSGMGQSAAVTATIGTGILMLVACIIVATFIDKVGRRIVVLVGYVGMLIVTSAITVFIVLFETYVEKEFEGKEEDDSSKENNPYIWTTYASAACVYLFLVSYSVGPGVVPVILASEMFSQGARTAAVCVSIALTALAAFFVTVLFPLASSAVGGYTFLIFVGLQVFYICYAYFNVPETKGKDPEEIVKNIREGWERKKKA